MILAHAPAGSSTKTIIHYAQEINHNGDFIQFDYGKARNLVIYGNSTPPPYNLQNINVSTYFMYGNNDWLADPMVSNKHFIHSRNTFVILTYRTFFILLRK